MKTQDLETLYHSNPLAACRKALRITRKLPEEKRLEEINKLLKMHGTEAIRGEWQNGFWCDIVASYCNAGETYALTVIQVRGESRYDKSRFIVSSMGDFVEKNQEKFAIV